MYKFESTGKFNIKGRGLVFTVRAPHEYPRDKCPFMNENVEIDGVEYRVVGVESFAVCPTRKGADIGLLVADPTFLCDDTPKER